MKHLKQKGYALWRLADGEVTQVPNFISGFDH